MARLEVNIVLALLALSGSVCRPRHAFEGNRGTPGIGCHAIISPPSPWNDSIRNVFASDSWDTSLLTTIRVNFQWPSR